MTKETEDGNNKSNLLNLESKLADAKTSEKNKCSLSLFLEKAAILIDCELSDFTGHVSLHIRDGELTSWESKATGRYND